MVKREEQLVENGSLFVTVSQDRLQHSVLGKFNSNRMHVKENDMIDNNIIEKIIEERKKMHPDDPRVVEKWSELTQIFIQNEENTIAYLNSCCKENIYWISEIFEDISEQLRSSGFIECIEQLAIKYPDLDLEYDILYAKKALE